MKQSSCYKLWYVHVDSCHVPVVEARLEMVDLWPLEKGNPMDKFNIALKWIVRAPKKDLKKK